MHWSAPVSCFHTRPIYSTYSTCCPVLPRAVSIHVLCPSWSNTKSILNSMCLTNGSTIFCRSVTSYSCLGMRFSAKSSTGSISIVSLIFVPNLFDWVFTTWSPETGGQRPKFHQAWKAPPASRPLESQQETLPVQQTMLSLDWFKGKITGNHRFSHQI